MCLAKKENMLKQYVEYDEPDVKSTMAILIFNSGTTSFKICYNFIVSRNLQE